MAKKTLKIDKATQDRAMKLLCEAHDEYKKTGKGYFTIGMKQAVKEYRTHVLPNYTDEARERFESKTMGMLAGWADFIATEPPMEKTALGELFDIFGEYDPNYYGGG